MRRAEVEARRARPLDNRGLCVAWKRRLLLRLRLNQAVEAEVAHTHAGPMSDNAATLRVHRAPAWLLAAVRWPHGHWA